MSILVCFTAVAGADSYKPLVSVEDRLNDVVYYDNGTISYGDGYGSLVVCNPTSSSPLSAVNITLFNGSRTFVDRIDPGSNYTIGYNINHSDIEMPLKLKETIGPASLNNGIQQQIRLCVEIENTGNTNITGFVYQKVLPSGLTKSWTAYDGGTLCVNSSVTWTMDNLGPGEKKHLAIAFNLTPSSNVIFPEAHIRFDYLSSLTGKVPDFSGSTTTTFQVQKSHLGAGTWLVDASVPDNSEFIIHLNGVSIYRSDANDAFNMAQIAVYSPNATLDPASTWSTSLLDNFDFIPAYFIRISYTIPYTVEQISHVSAKTEPFTIMVSGPQPPYPPQPYNHYVPWTPTMQPLPAPPPIVEPDIVFVTPGHGEVIIDNTTKIETSVPPSNDTGYVIYYGSPDNKTWVKLGESPITGNMSELMWNVPQMNGTYYLKAEHYNLWGLRGIAFTQVLVAHDILPVGMTTMLISGVDWLMLLAALAVFLLLLFILLPYLRRVPVIYDSSALYELSRKDKDWLSGLPRQAIRPDEIIFEIENVGRIKMNTIKGIDEMRRFEREYGLQAYDAMALQLAREAKATLYTADERMIDICKKYDISFKQMEKIKVLIKV